MKQDSWSGEERALFEALQKMVSKGYSNLSREKVRAIFDAILSEWPEGELAKEESGGWTGRIDSGVVRPFLPNAVSETQGEGADLPSVDITADTPGRVNGILHQVLQVGAILVELDPKPALNELVAVRLDFPDAHLTVETEGRVVHQSPRGTAIEVSGLTKEDRLALQAIQVDSTQDVHGDGEVPGDQKEEPPEPPTMPSVGDSFLEPGVIPPVQEAPDPNRSFAPFSSRRGARRRMVSTTQRRRVDLPTPDMNVAQSTLRGRKPGGRTREFYGPPPEWLEPKEDADRIEELASERVIDILLQLSENGFTGILEYDDGGGAEEEQYVFDSGYVVERACKPRVAEEEMGPMLQAADRITKRQLAMAAAHADELGLTVARSLMDLDILSPDELRHAIAGRLTFLLREFCNQTVGNVRIFDSRALPAGFLPQPPLRVHVAVERVVYDRLYRELSQMSTEEREKKMVSELDAYPEIIGHERDRLERAVTQPDQRRLVERVITGRKRLREALTESALSPAETFAVVFSLHRMGLVRFDRSLHATVVRERMRENVTVKYLSVHKASYFEVLNVHWSSYSEVIEKAYRELLEQFDPVKVPDQLEDEVHQRVREITERVEAAYAALAKRKTRHAYRTRIMPEYKLAHAIPLFLKQSELADRRAQWEEARDAIRRVLEIDPEHKEAQRRLDRFNQILDGTLSPDPSQTNQ